VIEALKSLAKRWWPPLRLRTILLGVLLFAAAMPAIGAVSLRVYENLLVRQAEGEIVAQSAALAATASVLWPGSVARPPEVPQTDSEYYRPKRSSIDLSSTPVLPERPLVRAAGPADPDALLAAARLDPILTETTRDTLAASVLTDSHGRVVRGVGLGGDLGRLPEVRAALEGQPATVLRRNADYHPRYSLEWLSRASALRIHHAQPVWVNGTVAGVLLVSRSPRALFRGIYEDRGKMGLGAAVILIILVALSGLVSRGVTRPIEKLSAATRAVAAGRGEVPETPSTAAIEIRALYQDFRAMAEAITRRSRYLRDFAAALSHEFKTPLASVGGAVELLQDHYETMSQAERERFLANIAADTARLSQLVARLLDLARADMARPEADAKADVTPPARRIADALGTDEFTVTLDLASDLPRVAASEAVLEAVIAILVENSRQAGAHTLRIGAVTAEDTVTLAVTDDGPGVPAPDRLRLFEPFFTTRRAEGGTGLGLAIARSLVEAHGGTVDIVDSATGARFEVRLPRA
jgi:signal transduction histidine kinase